MSRWTSCTTPATPPSIAAVDSRWAQLDKSSRLEPRIHSAWGFSRRTTCNRERATPTVIRPTASPVPCFGRGHPRQCRPTYAACSDLLLTTKRRGTTTCMLAGFDQCEAEQRELVRVGLPRTRTRLLGTVPPRANLADSLRPAASTLVQRPASSRRGPAPSQVRHRREPARSQNSGR